MRNLIKYFIAGLFILNIISCSPSIKSTRQLPVARVSQPTHKKIEKPLILIDAGHGAHDLGTSSSDKRHHEKSLNLTTALLVCNHLKHKGFRTTLTRQRDRFITLEGRVMQANRAKASLFVSIHFNSSSNKKAEGIEVFYYPSKHNHSRTQNSKKLADILVKTIKQKTHALNRGVKEASFFVIRNTHMPAVLIEGGFMTNPKEMAKLKNPTYLNLLAIGIAEGISNYFEK
ncbi:MAG: amiA [Chlamydiales bacterium]|jgi:N-acetylmuramoyl-L-alanine amidase|nr:amiA [Chlamydiales bacterium]